MRVVYGSSLVLPHPLLQLVLYFSAPSSSNYQASTSIFLGFLDWWPGYFGPKIGYLYGERGEEGRRQGKKIGCETLRRKKWVGIIISALIIFICFLWVTQEGHKGLGGSLLNWV